METTAKDTKPKCDSQSVTPAEDKALVFEKKSVKTGTLKLKLANIFKNSESDKCPMTVSIVDKSGNEIDAQTQKMISIFSDEELEFDSQQAADETEYALQLKAVTPFGKPVFKDLVIKSATSL